MSGTFAASAGRLAGMAGLLLGWSPDAFWRATPAELGAVLDAMGDGAEGAPPGRADIARLMDMFPDE